MGKNGTDTDDEDDDFQEGVIEDDFQEGLIDDDFQEGPIEEGVGDIDNFRRRLASKKMKPGVLIAPGKTYDPVKERAPKVKPEPPSPSSFLDFTMDNMGITDYTTGEIIARDDDEPFEFDVLKDLLPENSMELLDLKETNPDLWKERQKTQADNTRGYTDNIGLEVDFELSGTPSWTPEGGLRKVSEAKEIGAGITKSIKERELSNAELLTMSNELFDDITTDVDPTGNKYYQIGLALNSIKTQALKREVNNTTGLQNQVRIGLQWLGGKEAIRKDPDIPEKALRFVMNERIINGVNRLSPENKTLFDLQEKQLAINDKMTSELSPTDLKALIKEKIEIDSKVDMVRGSRPKLFNYSTGKYLDDTDTPEDVAQAEEDAAEKESLKLEYLDNDSGSLIRSWNRLYSQLNYIKDILPNEKAYNFRGQKRSLDELENPGAGYVIDGLKSMDLSEIEEIKAASDAYDEILKSAQMKFDAVNEHMLLNVDPKTLDKGFWDILANDALEVIGVDMVTDGEKIDNFVAGIRETGGRLTEEQEVAAEELLRHKVARGLVPTTIAMIDLIATTYATGSAGTSLKLVKYGRLIRRMMSAKWGTKGRMIYNTIQGQLLGTMNYSLSQGEQLTASRGFGEGTVQGLMRDFNPAKFFGKTKYAQALGFLTRTAIGGTAETMSEYAGEYVNHLTEHGFQWKRGFEETFGRTVEDKWDRLAVIAITSFAFSGAYNVALGTKAYVEIKNSDSANKAELLEKIEESMKDAGSIDDLLEKLESFKVDEDVESQVEAEYNAQMDEDVQETVDEDVQKIEGQRKLELDEIESQKGMYAEGHFDSSISAINQKYDKQLENAETLKQEEVTQVKEESGPFTTKSGNQTVEFLDGELVVKDKKGSQPSPNTTRKAIREYEDQYDYSKGDRVKEVGDVTDTDVADQQIIDETTSPMDLVDIHDRQLAASQSKDAAMDGSKEDIIADVLDRKVKRQSFVDNASEADVGKSISLSYFNNSGMPLDEAAKYASELSGVDITEQDLVDFIKQYPNGPQEYRVDAKRNPIMEDAKSKFRDLTGMDLNERTSHKAREQELTNQGIDLDAAYDQIYDSKEQFKADFEQQLAESEGTVDQTTKDADNVTDIEGETAKTDIDEQAPEAVTAESIDKDIESIKEGKTSVKEVSNLRSKIVDSDLPFDEKVGLEKRLGEVEVARLEKIAQKQGKPSIKEALEKAADNLEQFKIGDDKLYALPPGINLTPALWNGAVATLKVSLRGGAKIAEAVDMAVEYIKSKSGGTFDDEATFRETMTNNLEAISQPDPNTQIVEDTVVAKPPKTKATKKEAVESTDQVLKEYRDGKKEYEGLQLPETTWKEKFLTKFQNRYNRVKNLMTAIKDTGVDISDKLNVNQKLEAMVGRIKNKNEKIYSEIVKSKPRQEKAVFERMKDDGVSLDDLGLYMYARHAVERNAANAQTRQTDQDLELTKLKLKQKRAKTDAGKQKIQQQIDDIVAGKNPKFQLLEDGGSGMTNQKAADIMDKIEEEGNTEKFTKYADEISEKLIAARQKLWVEYGLQTQETVDMLNNKYEHYVPLSVKDMKSGESSGSSKSLDVKGKDFHGAKGSSKYDYEQRVNPIIQAFANYLETVAKAEKNIVDQSFLELVKEIDSPDMFEVKKPKYKQEFDSNGDPTILYRDYNKESDANTLELRVDGEIVLIEIKDQELAEAMKGIGVKRAVVALVKVNNYVRAMSTLYNPEFTYNNFIKDVQTALIHLSVDDAKNVHTDFVKNIGPAMKGIWQNEMGTTDTEWSDIAREVGELGGEVGWQTGNTIEDHISDLETSFKRYASDKTSDKLINALGTVDGYIDRVNKMVEMASRVAAYKASIDNGMSKEQAINLAKNLTVNFNTKGNVGAYMDSFYLFSSVGIQGTTRMITALKNKRVRKIALGVMAASLAINYMNKAINEEEWNKIPDWKKERNLIFMTPSGEIITLPLPWGYNVFKVMGDIAYDQIEGRKTVGESMKHLLISMSNAFNPISSATLFQTISPTALDPFAQQVENINWAGSGVTKEQAPYGDKVPESQLYFESVRPASKAVTDYLNELTDGNEVESGWIDISPELIDHYIDFIGGGAGAFVANTLSTAGDFVQGEEFNPKRAPFIRKMYSPVDPNRDKRIIYEMAPEQSRTLFSPKKTELFLKSLDNAEKEGAMDKETVRKYREKFLYGQAYLVLKKKYPKWSHEKLDHKAQLEAHKNL